MSTRVHRWGRDQPALSCARCYNSKKKCDKKVPSCTRCARAGVPCVGINRSNKNEVPRSTVQYLESRLAKIGHAPPYWLSDDLSSRQFGFANLGEQLPDPSEDEYNLVVQIINTAIGSISTSCLLRGQSGLYHEADLFYASERPPLKIPVRGMYNENPPRLASQGSIIHSPKLGAQGIPFGVAKTLFDNYLVNVLPRFPCFLESELMEQFNLFFSVTNSPRQIESESTHFICSMTLAISALTSKTPDFRKVALLSESLWRDAIQYKSFLRHTNFKSLQCFILLIQLALLLPYTSNLWYLSGEAMRMAIALGLHQEPSRNLRLTMQELNLRRSTFWTVYQLERTVSIASGCPLAILDDHITTLLPSDTEMGPTNVNPERINRKKFIQFLNNVELCQIQSEIHGIQFFDQPLPRGLPSYEQWVHRMEQSIQTWQDRAASEGDQHRWSFHAANHCRLLLYRPCTRNILPSEASLMSASTMAINMINGCQELVQTGKLILSFQYVFSIFQAGMILLYSLRNHGQAMRSFSIHEDAISGLDLLHKLLDTLSARWPAATDTGFYIQELKDTIIRSLVSEYSPSCSAYDINLLAELDFMVSQRRVRSLYHQNITISTPDEIILGERSSMPRADSTTPLADEFWQEMMDTGFEFLADDSPLPLESFAGEQLTQWNDFIHDAVPESTVTTVDTEPSVDIEALMDTIPACAFCRSSHLKCDRELPTCGACKNAQRDCTYYDTIMEKHVLRSYVYDLCERYKSLDRCGGKSSNPVPDAYGTTQLMAFPLRNILHPQQSFQPKSSDMRSFHMRQNIHHQSSDFDHIFFGQTSFVAHLQLALSQNQEWRNDHVQEISDFVPAKVTNIYLTSPEMPPLSMASNLFRLFSMSINLFYPTVKIEQMDHLMTCMYHDEDQSVSTDDHETFWLIMAIGCQLANKSSHGSTAAFESFFQKANSVSKRPRHSWINADMLKLFQKTLLICIYLLASPGSGDIWRNLGFAIRVYFDLLHRPCEEDGLDEEHLCMLTRTLYCIESQVSMALGRPSLLVIGDKIREDIARPRSSTVREFVAAYFYRISLLKMQIHSALLMQASNGVSQASAVDGHEEFRNDIDVWLTDWKEGLSMTMQDHEIDKSQCMPYLEAWADMHYHHTLLLLNSLSSILSQDIALSCDVLVRSCATLVRHEQRCLLLNLVTEQKRVPIAPANWTTAHLLFSVGLNFVATTASHTAKTQWKPGLIQRCLTVLALLEGDVNTLSTGFTEVLERLQPREGSR